jgi:Tetratricopeptide repeat
VTLAREAELALTLDRHQSAHSLMAQAQQMDAANPYVIAVSGLVYLVDGQGYEAKAAFETALKRDPHDARALLGLGLAEIRLGNFDAGLQDIQAANNADPGNALILTYLGRVQQQLGRTGAAMASWRSAEQADPRDPMPWLYQAQAQLQANDPMSARTSLHEAQARVAYRSVYRGESLLQEDRQMLQANLAEVQRQLGMNRLAFETMADFSGEPSSASLRDQADLLQGQRFAESARRSLLLQSLFNEKPGNLPAALDIYGDGAGETGASAPQHSVVSSLSPQQASYNDYGALFTPQARLAADATAGNQKTRGEQIRAGAGSDTLGISLVGLRFRTDGNAPFQNLDNSVAQGIAQWRPLQDTQVFAVRQTFDSNWGGAFYPADPFFGSQANVQDNSQVTRLGLRQTLADNKELRGLLSFQRTDQTVDYYDFSTPANYFFSQTGSSNATGAELQYRSSGTGYASQWGVQHFHTQLVFPGVNDVTILGQQVYTAWQWSLNTQWQLDANLGWGRIDNHDNTGGGNGIYLARWLPQLGVVYAPDDATHVRLAAWQGLGITAPGDASLAPVSLAGILLARPGDNGKLVQAAAFGADRQLAPDWLLEINAQRRKAGLPVAGGSETWQQLDLSKLALHWQPAIPWNVSLAYEFERLHNDPGYTALDSVDQQSLRSGQLDLRWFAVTQWTVDVALSHNQVDGTQKSVFLPSYRSSFNQVDASTNWKFNEHGSLTAGVRNAADAHFRYAEVDPLNPRFSQGRLVYGKVQLAW